MGRGPTRSKYIRFKYSNRGATSWLSGLLRKKSPIGFVVVPGGSASCTPLQGREAGGAQDGGAETGLEHPEQTFGSPTGWMCLVAALLLLHTQAMLLAPAGLQGRGPFTAAAVLKEKIKHR